MLVPLPPDPCNEGPCDCDCDCDDDGAWLSSLCCCWCCDVAVGDEEFGEAANEFCCPPAAIEYAGPCGSCAGLDAPLGLALPLDGGAPDEDDLPNEFDLLGVVLVGVVVLLLPLVDALDGRLEFCSSGSLLTGFLGEDAGGAGGGYTRV